jgi:hypothetical protein
MRAIYLLQTAIFAFLTVDAKESYLYIYVEDDLKNNVLVVGQTYTTGTTIYQSSYKSDLYDRCLNKTETGLDPFKSPECKNQPVYAYITMIYLEAVDNKPRHLDIVMPKYNLSVRYKRHSLAMLELVLQCELTLQEDLRLEPVWVGWAIGSGLYAHSPDRGYDGIGIDCHNITK